MKPVVVDSVNAPDGVHCVDIFKREDGSFGFELFRRDPEDGHGWRATGHHGAGRYTSSEAARAASIAVYAWVADRA